METVCNPPGSSPGGVSRMGGGGGGEVYGRFGGIVLISNGGGW